MIKSEFINFKGEIYFKEDLNYEEKRLCWNRAIDKKPFVIAYCRDNNDIKICLNLIKKHSMPFRIRSGAHHYEGFSTGDNLFVIDVSMMDKINLDIEKNTLQISAGTRNREVYEVVCKYHIPFPGGGCPTVGAIGYTLGGGWGYSARYLGLGIDNLLEVELLNYNGELIKANSTENPDLFWALKGAGSGNFGIVTSMTFNLPKKVEICTLVLAEITNITTENMVPIFNSWLNEIQDLDPRLNMKVAFYNDRIKGLGIKITGIFYGENYEALKAVKKITLDYNWNYDLREMSILDINRWIQDNHPDYEFYKSNGRFIDDKFNSESIQGILNILNEKPDTSSYAAISLYGMSGNIENAFKNNNSFAYRNTKGVLGFQAVWEYENNDHKLENEKWVIENSKIIKKETNGSFVNFPLAELNDYMKEYFGENTEKLKEIKREYDPYNFFNFEQSIK